MITRAPRHRTFHVHRAFYYTEDSVRGILLALLRLFGWIDLDCHVTKDGVLVICHGPRLLSKRLTGGFYDPLGLIDENATVEELTWAEVSRLRSRDGKGYRVSRADRLVPMALRKGLNVELEVKSSKITEGQLLALAISAGNAPHPRPAASRHPEVVGGDNVFNRVQVKGFPKFLPALKAAHQAGYTTIALTHPGQRHLPVSARAWLDYFRGRTPIWVNGR